MKKKIIGLIMSALMIASVLPTFADEIDAEQVRVAVSSEEATSEALDITNPENVTDSDELGIISHEAARTDLDVTKAKPIEVNAEGFSDQLESYEAVNIYKFVLDKDSGVTVDFGRLENKTSSGFAGYSVTIYDANCNSMVTRTITGTEKVSLPTLGIPSGTYYLVVELKDKWRWGFASEKYSLKVNTDTDRTWEREFNDSKDSANAISVKSVVHGYITTNAEEDWYRFSIPADGIVYINLARDEYVKDNAGWEANICDLDGNVIHGVVYQNSENTESAKSNTIGLAAGDYLLKINGHNKNNTYNAPYHFYLDYEQKDNWEKEANNTIDKANTIGFDTQYSGVLYTTQDEDWYKITTDRPMEIKLTHGCEKYDQFYGWWQICIYNANKTKISEDRFRAQNDKEYVERDSDKITLGTGTYYIQVKEQYSYGLTARYTIKLSEASIPSFVNRLYKILLGRDADKAGLDDWSKRLADGSANSAQIVEGIANSPEFKNKNYSNSEIVERMYEAMLGRASDEGGKKDWVGKLDNGMSVNAIINGFSGSEEFGRICKSYGIQPGSITLSEARDQNPGVTAFVARCYTKALGRAYDVDGLNDWCGRILGSQNQRQAALDMASNGFFHSQEFANKNTNNAEYVDILYRTFLGREADENGRADWVGQLDAGKSRDDVMAGFSGSVEFDNIMKSYGL